MKLKDKIGKFLIDLIGERGDILIPNYYLGAWEADLLRIRRSGMVYEYEIKTTRADYFNDFKKEYGESVNKHKQIEEGTAECNRFYFVVPENMITKDEVPPYAGLIYYKEYMDEGEARGYFRSISEGKLIRKKFTIDYETIARKLSFREQILRNKFRCYNNDLAILKDENRRLRAVIKKLNKENDPVTSVDDSWWETLTNEEKIHKYFTCMYGDNFRFSMVDEDLVDEFCVFNKLNKETTITFLKIISNED